MSTFEEPSRKESSCKAENSKRFKRKTSWQHYFLAVALALIAFAIRWQLGSIVGNELPFMLFIAAALVAAWYGGALAGFIGLFLGLALAEYFIQGPKGSIAGVDSVELLRLLRYVFTGALGVILIALVRRDEARAKAEVERRKRSEAALEQASALLRQNTEELEHRVAERTKELSVSVSSLESILYHIAHNFRAPARAMEGFIRLLEEHCGQNWDATAHDYANRISSSAKQLDRLTKDLVAYGGLTHVNVRPTDVSLEHAIDHAQAELSERIRATGADILVERPLPDVRADDDMLGQVLFQLLDNAIKFVPAGTRPRIRIWTDLRESEVRLWVQDNGMGIDTQYQEKVFQPFERQKVVAGYEGNGVGLAIVKEGMQRMNGRVGVESQAGTGSRFWIELPTAPRIDESQELPTFTLSEQTS